MSDDHVVVTAAERKTATHKQIIGGAALAAVFYWMPQLNSLFFTRQEGQALIERVTETQESIKDLKGDLNTKIDSIKNDIIDEIRAAEGRTVASSKEIQDRVNRLEDMALTEQHQKKKK